MRRREGEKERRYNGERDGEESEGPWYRAGRNELILSRGVRIPISPKNRPEARKSESVGFS